MFAVLPLTTSDFQRLHPFLIFQPGILLLFDFAQPVVFIAASLRSVLIYDIGVAIALPIACNGHHVHPSYQNPNPQRYRLLCLAPGRIQTLWQPGPPVHPAQSEFRLQLAQNTMALTVRRHRCRPGRGQHSLAPFSDEIMQLAGQITARRVPQA